MKKYWQIDGDNNIFETLEEAKYHVWVAYTPDERKKYLRNTQITHVTNEQIISTVDIRISDSGEPSYGRAIKF